MSYPLSLIGSQFIPTSSFSGGEPSTIYRGRNCRVRGLGANPYVECYPGSKDLGETYTLASFGGGQTVSCASGSKSVTGAGTSFLTQLRPGQMFLAGTEVFVVNSIQSDTALTADRAASATVTTQTPYYLFILFELDGKRGVLRRGNAILLERKDILLVGDGDFFLNGTDTTFDASRTPKRLQKSSAGAYTEFKFGFPDAPPAPTLGVTTAGWKGMISGSYSFMVSYYNQTTGGFSNPCQLIKQSAGSDIVVAVSGRFTITITNVLAAKPNNADGILIWGSQSGGGVTATNTSNFNEGPWLEVRRLPFTAKTITAWSAGNDTLTIPDHGFQSGDWLVYIRTGGTTDINGLTGGTRYLVFVKDDDTVQLASSAANFRSNTVVDITGAGGDGTNTLGYFDSSNVAHFEYLDAELGQVASGDNDPPPECEWVCEFAGQLQYISCFGNRTSSTDPLGQSFGSFVVPSKGANREAAPYRWRVGVEEDITGFAKGAGKLFVLTRKGIPFLTPTGATELARLLPAPLDLPFTWRPFWTKGSIQPYALCVIQNDVYLYSGNQPLRSPSTADVNIAPFEIGRLIADLTANHADGHTLVAHDPRNQQACIILSAVRKNVSGFWESEIIPLDLAIQPQVWQPKILLTSTTRDMIVSGAAYVDNRLEFIAGGRVQGGTFEQKAYRYDERLGSGSVDWSVAFQPTDNGEEGRGKEIKYFRATGRLTSPIVQVHGADWASIQAGTGISPDDIEAGINSLTGNISLTSTGGNLRRLFRKKYLVKNLALYSVRIAGTWADSGSNSVDRLDELVIGLATSGGEY